jgi:hypothetical protein
MCIHLEIPDKGNEKKANKVHGAHLRNRSMQNLADGGTINPNEIQNQVYYLFTLLHCAHFTLRMKITVHTLVFFLAFGDRSVR